jgi:uncharacterized membrane protein
LEVFSGITEKTFFKQVEILDGRALHIALGMNDDMFFETPLNYVRAAQDFEGRAHKLHELAAISTPSALIAVCGSWARTTPGAKSTEEERIGALREVGTSSFLPFGIPIEALGLIFGTFAQVAFFSDVGRDTIPVWLRIGLHSFPVALVVFLVTPRSLVTGLANWCVMGANVSPALCLLLVGAAAAGWRTEGWISYIAMNCIGALCAALLLKKTAGVQNRL